MACFLRARRAIAMSGYRGYCVTTPSTEDIYQVLLQAVAQPEPARNLTLKLMAERWTSDQDSIVRERERWTSDVRERNLVAESIVRERNLVDNLLHAKDKEIAALRVRFLEAKDMNDVRGLIEYLTNELEMMLLQGRASSRGVALWEQLIKASSALKSDLADILNTKDEHSQAVQVYQIYSMLSEHIHEGKTLAQVKALQEAIAFYLGPLNVKQGRVIVCLGTHAKVIVRIAPELRRGADEDDSA